MAEELVPWAASLSVISRKGREPVAEVHARVPLALHPLLPTELEVHTYSKEPPPAGWASFECTGPAALAGFADYLRRGPKLGHVHWSGGRMLVTADSSYEGIRCFVQPDSASTGAPERILAASAATALPEAIDAAPVAPVAPVAPAVPAAPAPAAAATSPVPDHDAAHAVAAADVRTGRYAAVYLVMKGDAYVPGALVAGYSMRMTGTVAELVCMVTPDVSHPAREQLRRVFDHVREVEYVKAACRDLGTDKKKRMYDSWVNDAFTKWACLQFTEYDKVLFIDADKVILSNLDDLFALPAPAGTFSSPWAQPFDPRAKKPNPYRDVQHAQLIAREQIEQGYETAFLIGTTVLLAPRAGDFQDMLHWLASKTPLFGFPRCGSMMDEQCITAFFHERRPHLRWTYIHQRYNCIPWHPRWLGEGQKPRLFHYFNTKPWQMQRSKWLDNEAWWQVATLLVQRQEPLAAVFDAADLAAAPTAPVCPWCSARKVEGRAPHSVFDAEGRLECPDLIVTEAERAEALRAAQEAAAAAGSHAERLERWRAAVARAATPSGDARMPVGAGKRAMQAGEIALPSAKRARAEGPR